MLTAAAIRAAKPKAKDYKLPDAGGLYLWVSTKGAKVWRMRVVRNGKETTDVLGPFPTISLAEAREKRDQSKVDQARGAGKFAPPRPLMPTLRTLARRWMDTKKPDWLTLRHELKNWQTMERHVLNFVPPGAHWPLGDMPIDEIEPPMILAAMRKNLEPRSVDVAHRTLARLVRIFSFGYGEAGSKHNPALGVSENLLTFEGSGLRHAITDLDEARACLLDLVTGSGRPHTRLAILLLALTSLRPTELCGGEWSEVDGDLWTVPGARMKPPKLPHEVPLSRQAVETFDVLRGLTGRGRFMFTSLVSADAPLNIATIETLHREKYRGKQQPHGWRTTFSTNMNERYPHDYRIIELMLAHKPVGAVEGRYNRAEHMPRRRELAQIWADILLGGFPSAAELVK